MSKDQNNGNIDIASKMLRSKKAKCDDACDHIQNFNKKRKSSLPEYMNGSDESDVIIVDYLNVNKGNGKNYK